MELVLGPTQSETKEPVALPLALDEQEAGETFGDLLAEAEVPDDISEGVRRDQDKIDPLGQSKLVSQAAVGQPLVVVDQPLEVFGDSFLQETFSQQELDDQGSATVISSPKTRGTGSEDLAPKPLNVGTGENFEETLNRRLPEDSATTESQPKTVNGPPVQTEAEPKQIAAEKISSEQPQAVPRESTSSSPVKLEVPVVPKDNASASTTLTSEAEKSGEKSKVEIPHSAPETAVGQRETAAGQGETLPDSSSFSHQDEGNPDPGQQQSSQTKHESPQMNSSFNLDVTSTSTTKGAESVSQASTVEREVISTENLIQQVKLNVKTGISRISFMVDPPELGRLNIQLVIRNGRLTGVIEAESEDVERALLRGLESLKETMRAAGIHVDSLDVKSSPNQLANDSWRAATDEGRGESFSQRRGQPGLGADQDMNAKESAESKIETVDTGESLINLIA